MARQTKQTQRTKQQRSGDARRAIEQRKADAVLMVLASEKLANDRFDMPPRVLRNILARFLELAEQEAARRLPGKPKSDWSGQTVAVLIDRGWSQADARRRVARIFKKTHATVARAHNRYRRETRQK
jgi:hypothetical protein